MPPGQLLIPVPSLQDIKRCLNALEELGTLQVTSHILQKHTDVVATLKKVEQRAEPSPGGVGSLPGPPGLRGSLLLLPGADPALQSQQGRDGKSGRSLHPVEVACAGTKDGIHPESQQSRAREGQGGGGEGPGEAVGSGDTE